jgi:hypothetical protein
MSLCIGLSISLIAGLLGAKWGWKCLLVMGLAQLGAIVALSSSLP